MLETLMKLYVMAMAYDVRSPTPHLVGPPGCGKSTTVEKLAELLGVNLHIINVARLSPLETEGVQMPVDENSRLHLIPAAFWSRLKENDIVLFDEFLRGFPEVYNGLLDIFTSRRAGDYKLPRVFMIAASNSFATYDKALEDRLLHLPVPDPRSNKAHRKNLARMLVNELGLMPEMVDSTEIAEVLSEEVLPMFDMLDNLKGKASSAPANLKGQSIRKLIGQVQLRELQSTSLAELIQANNQRAVVAQKWQYVVLINGHKPYPSYADKARKILDKSADKLTELQRTNMRLNLQLIEMEQARTEKEGVNEDDVIAD